jgi:hypothetical protein
MGKGVPKARAASGHPLPRHDQRPINSGTGVRAEHPQSPRYDALLALWRTYLHMRFWRLPEYEGLGPEDKEYFRQLVRDGRLFAHVEDCKRAALAAGLGDVVKDEWLNFLSAGTITPTQGLSEADRNRLAHILDEMYPLLVRLDPDAACARRPKDLIPMAVAVSEYHTSRVTIRRKIASGALHDYRTGTAARNTTILLSRAELEKAFLKKPRG